MNLELMAKAVKASGMRKMGSGLLIFGGLSFLLYVKALPAENYTSLVMVIVVTLMGANAFEHHAGKSKEAPDAPSSPAAPTV